MAGDDCRPIHRLKIWPEFFVPLFQGTKSFEVRRNDRDFRPGDELQLEEWDPRGGLYTGRRVSRRILYLWRLDTIGIPGFVAMELLP